LPQVLRNKNLATKFQILVEVASNQHQHSTKRHRPENRGDGASSIGLYQSAGKRRLDNLRRTFKVPHYQRRCQLDAEVIAGAAAVFHFRRAVLTNITTWAAIAAEDLKKGQRVSLEMKNGLLSARESCGGRRERYYVRKSQGRRRFGVTEIEGILALESNKSLSWNPHLSRRRVQLYRLEEAKKRIARRKSDWAIGIEAIVSPYRQIGIEPDIFMG